MLSGREWLNVVMKGTFDLCCTARAQSGERSNPKRGKKLRRSRLYKCMLAKEHTVLLLCYFIVRLFQVLAGGSRYPKETDEFGTIFFLFEKGM